MSFLTVSVSFWSLHPEALWPGLCHQEDTLQRILQKVLDEQLIPSEYIININDDDKERYEPSSMLPAFVYAVTNYQDRIKEGDIIAGANIIQRRNAINKWKSEDGLNIMKLSCDNVVDDNGAIDWESISLGKRYELPPDILTQLEQLIIASWWEDNKRRKDNSTVDARSC